MAKSDLQTVAHSTSHSPAVELATQHADKGSNQLEKTTLRKAKRTRPMLDVRTELTDEELKVSVA